MPHSHITVMLHFMCVCKFHMVNMDVPAGVLVLPHLTHYFVTCCCTVVCQSSATLLRHGVPLRVVVTSNSVIPQFWLVNLSFVCLTSTLCSLSVYSIMMASWSWIFSIHFWTTVNTKFVPSFYVLSYWNMQQIVRVCAVITRTCLPPYCTSVVNQLVKNHYFTSVVMHLHMALLTARYTSPGVFSKCEIAT